jgi:hypothetical protein
VYWSTRERSRPARELATTRIYGVGYLSLYRQKSQSLSLASQSEFSDIGSGNSNHQAPFVSTLHHAGVRSPLSSRKVEELIGTSSYCQRWGQDRMILSAARRPLPSRVKRNRCVRVSAPCYPVTIFLYQLYPRKEPGGAAFVRKPTPSRQPPPHR